MLKQKSWISIRSKLIVALLT